MTEQQLKEGMTYLEKECHNNSNYKKIIAKAVQLGMTYQEDKIKQGIKIVFNTLHE